MVPQVELPDLGNPWVHDTTDQIQRGGVSQSGSVPDAQRQEAEACVAAGGTYTFDAFDQHTTPTGGNAAPNAPPTTAPPACTLPAASWTVFASVPGKFVRAASTLLAIVLIVATTMWCARESFRASGGGAGQMRRLAVPAYLIAALLLWLPWTITLTGYGGDLLVVVLDSLEDLLPII